jgi:hypothetical protein
LTVKIKLTYADWLLIEFTLENKGKIVLDFLSQMCSMLENKNPTEKEYECIP